MNIPIVPQPDDSTCGPTTLHAVYNYYNYQIDLPHLIHDIKYLDEGGTLAVFLGLDALKRGFKARIITYNLMTFDPSWSNLEMSGLRQKLIQQLRYKKNRKLQKAILAYIDFLELGGIISFEPLRPSLFKTFFDKKTPILTGLSATYLYQSKREIYENDQAVYDDLRGVPQGHFVVLSGYTDEGKIKVADPYPHNPLSLNNHYEIDASRLINSILLGIYTYDANLLIINI